MSERIAKMGVEMEGGFSNVEYNLLCEKGWWHNDGSVGHVSGRAGEAVSPPLELEPLKEWVKNHYPTSTDKSCGFHIHISFKSNLDYSRLMCKRFFRHFCKTWEKWGEVNKISKDHQFWLRLAGKNSYCYRKFFDPDRQASHRSKGDDRYAFINFCYGVHQTVEFRLLPMFGDKELGLKAVTHMHDMVERWLAMQRREPLMERDLVFDVDPADTKEETVNLQVEIESTEETLCV